MTKQELTEKAASLYFETNLAKDDEKSNDGIHCFEDNFSVEVKGIAGEKLRAGAFVYINKNDWLTYLGFYWENECISGGIVFEDYNEGDEIIIHRKCKFNSQ